MRTPVPLVLPLLIACGQDLPGEAVPREPATPMPSEASGPAPDEAVPPESTPSGDQASAGGGDCDDYLAELRALLEALAADSTTVAQPEPSTLSASILDALEKPPSEAALTHFSMFDGLMITCDEGKALTEKVNDADERWPTLREELPVAIEACECQAYREALFEWLWVTGKHWPPS